MPQQQQTIMMEENQEMDEGANGTETATTSLLLPGCKLRGPQPPPLNPLQFIKVTPPVNLYKTPPQREPPPVERIRKEEPEDWQNDLEGWKVNRRKRQEQLMERVSEFKKSEEEQSNPSSRKNKTFSEMMRGRKCSIVVHNDEDNDLSDLGIGKKNGEDSEEEKIMVSEKENEFTYEKAIQNYVEFASSRVSKPVISTSTITQTNEINITSITNSSEATETDSWQETTVTDKRTFVAPDEAPSFAQDIRKTEVTTPQVSSQTTETRRSIQEKSSLFEKMSVFEKPVEIKTSKMLETKQSKPKEDIPTTPTKKLRPPVPAKPKPVQKEETPFVNFHEATSLENVPQQNVTAWNNMIETESNSSVSRINIEETTEMIFNSSSLPASGTQLRLQQTLVQSKQLEPSLVFSDDSSNIDMELSPTSSSAEMPVSNSNLKVMEPSVPTNTLDHVSHRDIQRSPLGGEDSGVHTADSVSQSDEVEEEEELPSQTNLEMSTGLLGILTSQTPIIDHELSALLAPPSRLEPPREKPPPPPPVGMEPDTETMRKSFLGLEMTPPQAAPLFEATTAETSETDCLGTQLKERLLRLEEEKNNIRNMEKQIKAEKLSPHAAQTAPAIKDSAGSQESLAREREALRIEREAIASRKQASFAKKLAVRSLDSLDIPPHHEIDAIDDRVFYGNGTTSNNNNNNNNMNNNNDVMKINHHHSQMSQDDTYLSKSVDKESMSQYFHPPVKQHSVDELQTSYEHQHNNDLISQSDNYNLPIRKSQSEGHLLSHQSIQQPYSSPPKQSINDRTSNHISQEQHQFSKQYQSKHQENNYQQNVVCNPKSSPEYPPSQPFYTPPSPRYEVNNKHYYEDTSSYYDSHTNEPAAMPAITSSSQGSWSKQANYIQPAAPIRKKGPPPPAKPSRIQQQHLTRNYSADSILESVDGDAPVPLRRNKPSTGNSSGTNGRSSMPYNLGGSMSQLPSQISHLPQPRQRPTSTQGINYQHWLVQEAEHRRITEQQQRQAAANPRQPKHLPDAIIMSLTQRVQQRQSQIPQRTSPQRTSSVEDKVLSVSGKKKCSHCNLELGRGAAMIIESLRLFYHIDCFKCCVCCIQLGDGLMGTDVRVRNGKLHCHSCYSSDDGVKFSCV